jgi:hypothetical protein
MVASDVAARIVLSPKAVAASRHSWSTVVVATP